MISRHDGKDEMINMIKKRVIFNIPQEMLLKPILYTINRQYDIRASIYMSNITDKEGLIKLELEG